MASTSSIMPMSTSCAISKELSVQKPQVSERKVVFPPGSMGLELEPVIKSSERELGCRIKDFYFSVNHSGIDRATLENSVAIGDVVSRINGEDVKSLLFSTIVEKLRSLQKEQRTVTFKNISATCKRLIALLIKIYAY